MDADRPAIRTFHARRGRLSAAKRQALDQLGPRFAPRPGDAPDAFEIGCGTGEVTLDLAARRPDWLVTAADVHNASVAGLLRRAATAEVGNLRIFHGDGLELLAGAVAPGSLELLVALFPDPWPKARHRRRRLVGPAFAELAADRLAPGGCLELATDRADYALAMQQVLADQPGLRGGPAPRPDRPVSYYEAQARDAGRAVHHLVYERT